jgi:hypothetical protein
MSKVVKYVAELAGEIFVSVFADRPITGFWNLPAARKNVT